MSEEEMTDQEAEEELFRISEESGNESDEGAPAAPKRKLNTNDFINSSLDEIENPDVLKQMVRNLRSENANHRRKNKAMEDEVLGLKSWKLDHLKGIADAEDRVAKADRIAKQYAVKAAALEFEIDTDLVDLITGETEEEIWEKAAKLANTTKKKGAEARNPLEPGWVPGPTQLLPGKRGNPITSNKPKSEGDDGNWLKEAWYR